MLQLQINLKFNTKQTASSSKASWVQYLLLCTSGSQINNFHERPYIQLLGKLWVNFPLSAFFLLLPNINCCVLQLQKHQECVDWPVFGVTGPFLCLPFQVLVSLLVLVMSLSSLCSIGQQVFLLATHSWLGFSVPGLLSLSNCLDKLPGVSEPVQGTFGLRLCCHIQVVCVPSPQSW